MDGNLSPLRSSTDDITVQWLSRQIHQNGVYTRMWHPRTCFETTTAKVTANHLKEDPWLTKTYTGLRMAHSTFITSTTSISWTRSLGGATVISVPCLCCACIIIIGPPFPPTAPQNLCELRMINGERLSVSLTYVHRP